jgi:hypothetical protein
MFYVRLGGSHTSWRIESRKSDLKQKRGSKLNVFPFGRLVSIVPHIQITALLFFWISLYQNKEREMRIDLMDAHFLMMAL